MSIICDINKHFDHRVRLGIMSILVVSDYANFKTLKDLLDITDGNLASHAKSLENAGYIKVEKQFIGRKPNTRYKATKQGKAEFIKHIDAIKQLIQQD
jgi:DNA-binding MarR family transcriptional regulator